VILRMPLPVEEYCDNKEDWNISSLFLFAKLFV
jgi:hypothetical protein